MWMVTPHTRDPWVNQFLAMEDPSDGYRSAMGSLYERMVRKEDFQPGMTPLRGTMTITPEGARVIFTADSGKELLLIGTDWSDGSYPCFLSVWTPPKQAEVEGG